MTFYIVKKKLFFLCFSFFFCISIGHLFSVFSFLNPSCYKPHNVIMIRGGSFSYDPDEVMLKYINLALQKPAASIVVSGYFLFQWLTQEGEAFGKKKYELDLLKQWNIYQIKSCNNADSNMYLLTSKKADHAQIESYFMLNDTQRLLLLDEQQVIGNVKRFEEQQFDQSDILALQTLALMGIFKEGTTDWIFFNLGHGSEGVLVDKQASFCGTSYAHEYEWIKFCGTTIKTLASFNMTCFAGDARAQGLSNHLTQLEKEPWFNPYLIAIYSLTSAETHAPNLKLPLFIDFFTQIRAHFLQQEKAGLKEDQNFFYRAAHQFVLGYPSSREDVTYDRCCFYNQPLIRVPYMESCGVLPASHLSIIEKKNPQIIQNKAGILLYSFDIDLLVIQTKHCCKESYATLEKNVLPRIIPMIPSNQDQIQVYKIKKLVSPASLFQTLLQLFFDVKSEKKIIFLIDELIVLDDQGQGNEQLFKELFIVSGIKNNFGEQKWGIFKHQTTSITFLQYQPLLKGKEQIQISLVDNQIYEEIKNLALQIEKKQVLTTSRADQFCFQDPYKALTLYEKNKVHYKQLMNLSKQEQFAAGCIEKEEKEAFSSLEHQILESWRAALL